MKFFRIFLVCTAAAMVAGPITAQNQAALVANPKAVTFDEPFVDPGNLAAKDLAERSGISVGQATQTLRQERAAERIVQRFLRDHPDAFAGAELNDGKVTILIKRSSLAVAKAEEVGRSRLDDGAFGSVAVREVGRSLRELKAQAEQLNRDIGTSSAITGYRVNPSDNRVEILAVDDVAARSIINARIGQIPADVTITQSEPITLTADGYGGTAANSSTATGCPTFGFVVTRTSDSARGLLTVAHAATDTMKYNGYAATALGSCSGGTSVIRRGTYQSADSVLLGQDFAWYNSSSQIYPPVFWNGSALATVTGGGTPAANTAVCKSGRKTGKTCGKTTGYQVYNGGYGWMLEVVADAGVAQMNDVGDSGGPVWSGTGFSVGIVHAKQGATKMLVAATYALEERKAPIRVLCNC